VTNGQHHEVLEIGEVIDYNKIDCIPSHAIQWLLRDGVRGEWGFEGFVISDYYVITEIHQRRVAISHDAALEADRTIAPRTAHETITLLNITTGKPVIVASSNGRPNSFLYIISNNPSAIVGCWYPGQDQVMLLPMSFSRSIHRRSNCRFQYCGLPDIFPVTPTTVIRNDSDGFESILKYNYFLSECNRTQLI